MSSVIRFKSTILSLSVASVLTYLLFSPAAQAVSPAPDGSYPGGNTAEGHSALLSLTTGGFNTAVGFFSLRTNTTNQFNTAIGAGALLANTANNNTATGAGALLHNTTGADNTASGVFALLNNATGSHNTATGLQALSLNTTGGEDTAIGVNALFNNTTGCDNTAIGFNALTSNTTGMWNTAIGFNALFSTTGLGNTGIGFQALMSNTTGVANVAVGPDTLVNNTTGGDNIALGDSAGMNVTTGSNIICVGAGVAGSNADSSCYIGNIFGHTVDPTTLTAVYIDANEKLGTFSSSRRFKHDIKPMDKASEAILALKPVTFHYNSDAKNTPCFGLIAEEVAAVNPALIVRDKNGEILTVRYDSVNAMLLNEFLKEHKKVEEQQAAIAESKSTFARQQKGFESKLAKQEEQIETLTAGLQKVTAQLELSKAAPQTVLNNQ
jgi:hypothetical protein